MKKITTKSQLMYLSSMYSQTCLLKGWRLYEHLKPQEAKYNSIVLCEIYSYLKTYESAVLGSVGKTKGSYIFPVCPSTQSIPSFGVLKQFKPGTLGHTLVLC